MANRTGSLTGTNHASTAPSLVAPRNRGSLEKCCSKRRREQDRNVAPARRSGIASRRQLASWLPGLCGAKVSSQLRRYSSEATCAGPNRVAHRSLGRMNHLDIEQHRPIPRAAAFAPAPGRTATAPRRADELRLSAARPFAPACIAHPSHPRGGIEESTSCSARLESFLTPILLPVRGTCATLGMAKSWRQRPLGMAQIPVVDDREEIVAFRASAQEINRVTAATLTPENTVHLLPFVH